ncbi:MAG: hypothetical protein ACTSP4_12415 [Candidatus Hodarchaeales archaeon]
MNNTAILNGLQGYKYGLMNKRTVVSRKKVLLKASNFTRYNFKRG